MSKLTEIYEGWKNVIFQTPEVEDLAKERALVCSECDSLILGVCSICCCPHLGKTHSPESRCPNNLWKDGWGTSTGSETETIKNITENTIPMFYWNEEKQDWTTEDPSDIKMFDPFNNIIHGSN